MLERENKKKQDQRKSIKENHKLLVTSENSETRSQKEVSSGVRK